MILQQFSKNYDHAWLQSYGSDKQTSHFGPIFALLPPGTSNDESFQEKKPIYIMLLHESVILWFDIRAPSMII